MNNVPARFATLTAGILWVGFMVGATRADTVVQFNFDGGVDGLNGPINGFQVQLLDSQAPITVANFLQYINNHRYDNTIIHREEQDFVMQGGGFTPVVSGGTLTAIIPISTYSPIQNEFSPTRSNVRGTIAMARVGGQPNSATSQWFVNVSDNSANLDYVDGGFTVFGKVIGEGMTLVDAVDSLTTYDLSSYDTYGTGALTQVPLVPVTNGYALIGITSVAVVPTIDWRGGNASGPTNWGLAANWNPSTGVPSGAGTKVSFGSQSSANSVVDMISAGRIVGDIYFSSTTNTTIQSSGNYNLTLNNNGSFSTISALGNDTISAPVIFQNNVNISGPGTLNLAGGISGAYNVNIISGSHIVKSIAANNLYTASGAKLIIAAHGARASGGISNPVPEPSLWPLLGLGILGMIAWAWQRRN